MLPRSISDFTGEVRQSGNQLNFRTCPVCGSDKYKLYVDPVTGKWFCFAGEHHRGGQVEVGAQADPNAEGRAILDLMDKSSPKQEWAEVSMPPFEPLSKRARRYMERRGINEYWCRRYGIVEWTDKFRVLWPYFDEKGTLIYWNSRSYSDNLAEGPKYIAAPGRHPLYVTERRGVWDSVVLVEGAFDAWAVNIVDPTAKAVALGGKTLPRYLRKDLRNLLNGATLSIPLKIALDPDATREALYLRDRFGGDIIDLPMDPADMLVHDPELLRGRLACQQIRPTSGS